MPLYLILKNISDSNLLGLYTDSSLSCPFQLLGSGCSRTISVRISDLPLTTGMPYYLNVVYRDSTSQKLSGIYSSSYGSNLYYDDISQLDGNYTTVLSQSFTITESVYTAPKIDNDGFLVDDNGDVIIDDSGNKIGYSNNYSNDVIGIKNGTTKSDAFATGGSASAQGGSASVINNNTVTVSPTISVTGASGGGTAQSFDDISSETMSNLLASCTNVVGFFKSMVSGLCPEYVWISIGVLVTVVIVLRIMGR